MSPAILPLTLALPFLAAAVLPLVRKNPLLVRSISLAAGAAVLLLSLWPLLSPRDAQGFYLRFAVDWVPSLGIRFALGTDGLSLPLAALTGLALAQAVAASWRFVHEKLALFHACVLLVSGCSLGVFFALDLAVMAIFWEGMLLPMYLLILLWGGPNRRYAATKFILYTIAGSVLFLVAVAAMAAVGGFDILAFKTGAFPPGLAWVVFLALVIGFAVKTPMFPLHTWLPAAHVEAPTAGSVILAAVLLKLGTYGLARLCVGLFPAQAAAAQPFVVLFSVAAVIYGAAVALGQTDVKRLIAYTSVSHMGFCTLGIFSGTALGMTGAIALMIGHGIASGLLFTLFGCLYGRSHSRELEANQGLARRLPVLGGFWVPAGLGGMGFPGLVGFVGEIMCMVAAFSYSTLAGVALGLGAMLSAAVMLKLLIRLVFLRQTEEAAAHDDGGDASASEWAALLPAMALAVILGLFPAPLLDIARPAAEHLVAPWQAVTTGHDQGVRP